MEESPFCPQATRDMTPERAPHRSDKAGPATVPASWLEFPGYSAGSGYPGRAQQSPLSSQSRTATGEEGMHRQQALRPTVMTQVCEDTDQRWQKNYPKASCSHQPERKNLII